MSRYIRQPGQSSYNEVDRQVPEWESIYSCYNWTETYNPAPRFEVNTNAYSALKVVISGYYAPNRCRTIWKTNNTSDLYYTKFHPQRGGISTPSYEVRNGSGLVHSYSSTAYLATVCDVTPGQSLELEIYPGMSDSISWRGDVMSPQTCCFLDLGGRGISCQSWNSIKYVEVCLEGFSDLRPTSCNSNWHLYGKRRG